MSRLPSLRPCYPLSGPHGFFQTPSLQVRLALARRHGLDLGLLLLVDGPEHLGARGIPREHRAPGHDALDLAVAVRALGKCAARVDHNYSSTPSRRFRAATTMSNRLLASSL